MNKLIVYISIIFTFSACDLLPSKGTVEHSESQRKTIAKVYEYSLYQDDLLGLFPANIPKEDSVEVAKGLIDSWAKKKILLKKAEVNMPSNNAELDLLVEKYREDLFVNSFKKALIQKELDTVVTIDQMEAYYQENKESFKINEELVKFKFIALNPKDKNRNKYKKLLVSNDKSDVYALDVQKMESGFLNDSTWIRYSDVQNKLPLLKKYTTTSILKPNKFIASRYNGSLYYISIKDVIHRNEIAPLRYISSTIKQMVIQQRKLQLIHKAEDVLLDDAVRNKQFEIY